MEQAMQPDLILFLVHGTWPCGLLKHIIRSKNHEQIWIHPSSAFCGAMAMPNITLRPFYWSGDNSILQRQLAVSQLRGELIEARIAYPEARILVLAHSHGGNIAIKASTSKTVDGIVTLGTPFLHFHNNANSNPETTALVEVSQVLSVTILVWLLLNTTVFLLIHSIVRSYDPANATSLIHDFTEPIILATLLTNGWIAKHIYQRLYRKLGDFRRRLMLFDEIDLRARPPLLIIRATRDEASLSLAVSQIAQILVEVISSRALYLGGLPIQFIDRHPRFGFLLFIAANSAFGIFIAQVLNHTLPSVVSPFVARALVLVVASMSFYYLTFLSLFLGFLGFCTGLILTVFGREMFCCGLMVEANAEPTPQGGSYMVRTITPVKDEDRPSPMRHSLHELPEVRNLVREWVQGRPPF